MRRITLTVLDEEREALLKLALHERRGARDQAALTIRAGVERRGLLPVDANQVEHKAQGVLGNASAQPDYTR